MGGVDLCDNLPSPEALTVQTQNLNQTAKLSQTASPALLQNEDRGGRGLYQKASPGNNGEDREEEEDKGGYREEDEEEDTDEVMKEEEEEEEVSEGSSSLLRCQSPDTPMTDSSYSETGKEHTGIHFHTSVLLLIFAFYFSEIYTSGHCQTSALQNYVPNVLYRTVRNSSYTSVVRSFRQLSVTDPVSACSPCLCHSPSLSHHPLFVNAFLFLQAVC